MPSGVAVSVKLNEAEIRQLLAGNGGMTWKAVQRAGSITRDRAKLNLTTKSLVGTGRLRQSIESQTFLRNQTVVSRVGTDVDYARYVHDGTSSPITPRRARVLRFKPKRASGYVFAPQVKGTKETGRFTPFLEDALKELKASDYT